MAEKKPLKNPEAVSLEKFKYKAGSYDRFKTNEEELLELVKLSGVPINKELFKVILELLKLNVAPSAILQVLKSLKPEGTPDDVGSQSPVLGHMEAAATDSTSHFPIHSKRNAPPSQAHPPLGPSRVSGGTPSTADLAGTKGLEKSELGTDGKGRKSRDHHKHKSRSSSNSSKGRHKDVGVVKVKMKEPE